jgi:hypothetical protein
VEASGYYNWLVDEMEQSGHRPKLCNPLEAKRRMGLTNKTDKLDARGLAILLRNGTLPEVWIPPSELRDQREHRVAIYCLVNWYKLSARRERKDRPVERARRTLQQFREAIQRNEIAFPSPAPKFPCQCKPEIQWRAAELFLIHGWTCARLGARYGVTRGRIWQYVRGWIDCALALGYLEDIPPADTMIFATNHTVALDEAAETGVYHPMTGRLAPTVLDALDSSQLSNMWKHS